MTLKCQYEQGKMMPLFHMSFPYKSMLIHIIPFVHEYPGCTLMIAYDVYE